MAGVNHKGWQPLVVARGPGQELVVGRWVPRSRPKEKQKRLVANSWTMDLPKDPGRSKESRFRSAEYYQSGRRSSGALVARMPRALVAPMPSASAGNS